MSRPEEWHSMNRVQGGQQVTVQWRALPSGADRKSHPHCLSLLWRLDDTTRTGRPTTVEQEEIKTFRDGLSSALGEAAFLSVVVIGKGHVELVYHVTGADEFIKHLEEATTLSSPDRLRVSHFYDPAWQHAERLLLLFQVHTP